MNTALIEQITELRQRLHACPELSGMEKQTLKTLYDYLSANTRLSLELRDGWLHAVHFEGDGLPAIGIRADMDAIPAGGGGARHGCGHDGHSAILCGLAALLEGQQVGRNIHLIFQPAEETGEGAKLICDTWPELDALDAVYALHNIPGFPKGAILMRRGCFACASRGLIVDVLGHPAHAAYPEEGANPTALLSRLALAIPGMIGEILKGDDRLLMSTFIGLRVGGENFGLSASEGRLCLTLRGYRQADIDALSHRIQAFTEEGCAAQGMRCRFENRDVFTDTTNDDAVLADAEARFRAAGLPVQHLEVPMRWSEDFGWFLKRRPGLYFGIGSGEDWPGLHTEAFHFDDALIPVALKALSAICGIGG